MLEKNRTFANRKLLKNGNNSLKNIQQQFFYHALLGTGEEFGRQAET